MKTRLLSILICCSFIFSFGNAFGSITYTTPNTFTYGTTITTLSPTITGGTVTAYAISPNLTANTGLVFNTGTGKISGTPTLVSAATVYTVTATGTGGGTFNITITVNSRVNTWKGTAGGANGVKWANSGNWSAAAIPGAGDDVEIGVATFTNQPSITTAANTVNSIKFGSAKAATITISGAGALAVTSGITVDGSSASASGTISGAVTVTAGSATLTSGSGFTSTLTLTSTDLQVSNALTINGGTTATIAGTGTITVGSASFSSGSASSLTLNNIALPITNDLTINGGTTATIIKSGTGSISTGTATFTSGTSKLTLTGIALPITNALTINGGALTTLTGTGTISAGSANFAAGAASSLTLTGMALPVTGALTINAGVTGTLAGTGTLTAGSATFSSGSASSLSLTGGTFTVTNALTVPTGSTGTLSIGTGLTPSAGSLALNGGAALTLSGAGSLTAGSTTLGAGTASTLTLSGGSFQTTNALTVAAGVNSTFTGTGSVTAGSATFTAGAASSLTLTGVPFTVTNALTAPTGSTGTLSIGTGLTPTVGSLAVNAGSALTLSGAGGLTAGSATFASGSASTLTLSGGALTVTNALTVNAGAIVVATGSAGITAGSATFGTGTAASLTLTGVPLTVSNAISINAGALATLAGTGTVSTKSLTFSGAAASLTLTSPLKLTATNDFTVGTGAAAVIAGTGNIDIAPLATLNVNGTGTLTTTLTGKLTLKSDSTGSACVGQILPTSITGSGADSIHVERFMTGGLVPVSHRGYYLMSSPVYAATVSSNQVYDLHYLVYGGMYLTGKTGFDKAGNPSVYLYREDRAPNNVTFVSGNFWGLSKFNNTNPYDYNLNQTATTYNIPVANGFMVFFRGARSAGTIAEETVTSFTSAPSVTLISAGTLNAGAITYHAWYRPAFATLGWSDATANSAIRGYNLLGNPYASTIDWETFNTTTPGTGIYASNANVGNIVYEYNPVTHVYDTYQKGGASTGNGSRYIVSGQGFFLQTSVDSTAQITFNESAKVTNQNTNLNLFMSTRANIAQVTTAVPEQFMRLQLVKDSVNTDNIYIGFNSAASKNYIFNEDAPYKIGTSVVTLASMSGDNVPLTINKIPPPALKGDTISLKVTASASGTYNLKTLDVSSMPAIYEIWLKDNYTKDSLDMRQNPSYAFNLNLADATTFGSGRFSLIVRENPALAIHLLNFTAIKATTGSQINWTTENEQNYTNFTVERSTDSGITFTALSSFTSGGLGAYNFLDTNPLLGVDMYRLKIVDLNGTITYSNVVSLTYNSLRGIAGNPVRVYPNPVKNTLNLFVSPDGPAAAREDLSGRLFSRDKDKSEKIGEYSITIVNNSGAVLKKAVSNQTFWQTDVSNFMPGSYIIQVVSKNGKGVTGQCVFIKL